MPDDTVRCESCGLHAVSYSYTWIAGINKPERITVGLCNDCFWREHRRHMFGEFIIGGGIFALLAGFCLLLFFVGHWKSEALRFGLTIPVVLGCLFLVWLFYGPYERSLEHKTLKSEIPQALKRFGLLKMRESGYSNLYTEAEWEQTTGRKIASVFSTGPRCYRCRNPLQLEPQDPLDPAQALLPASFLGTVCKSCGAVECYKCRGGVGLACSKCGGEVKPAYQKMI